MRLEFRLFAQAREFPVAAHLLGEDARAQTALGRPHPRLQIITVTAAVVVKFGSLPDLLLWLGPTVPLTPLIVWWNARILRPAR